MPARLILADAPSARDALTFAKRAAQAGAHGVRLQAAAGLLRMSAAALTPRGPLDRTPTILVLRTLRSDPQLQCDVTVETLTATAVPLTLALPETALAPAWTSVEPPQHGWRLIADVSSLTLMRSARAGIEAVAQALPDKPGDDVVRKIRGTVWGHPGHGTRIAATRRCVRRLRLRVPQPRKRGHDLNRRPLDAVDPPDWTRAPARTRRLWPHPDPPHPATRFRVRHID